MNIVVDIGNSFSKTGIFQDNLLVDTASEKGVPGESFFRELVEKYHPSSAIISSVSTSERILVELLKSHVNKIIVLDHTTPLPLKNKYETPETLGKDRIAAAVAANNLFPKTNVLVIDAGTSITYEFVTKNNEYLGGGISPGIHMRYKSLNNFTAHLPLIAETELPELIGNSTKNAIASGVIHGVIAEIKGIISLYTLRYPNLKIVLTGGHTNFLLNALKNDTFADPSLVLKGLNIILNYNVY